MRARGCPGAVDAGTFLRSVTFAHVRQLDAAAARLLPGPALRAPVLAGAKAVACVDVDDTVKRRTATPSRAPGTATAA